MHDKTSVKPPSQQLNSEFHDETIFNKEIIVTQLETTTISVNSVDIQV